MKVTLSPSRTERGSMDKVTVGGSGGEQGTFMTTALLHCIKNMLQSEPKWLPGIT